MTQVPKWFYGQVTYNDQKQAYVIVENNAIVPTANNMYVIYHDPTKAVFNMIRKENNFSKLVYINVN